MESKELIKQIILDGSPEQKRLLFEFDSTTPDEKVVLKFKLFSKSLLRRYFANKDADFHDGIILRTIQSYRGTDVVELGFRGSAKTTLKKLIRVYILLNDVDRKRKYLKVLCRDLTNSKQIVTDIYNMCLELTPIYGNVFEQIKEKKVEETMTAFVLASGVKIAAGTVGQKQRGHIQDAYRPDWIWFEDIEDTESISSQVITEGIIRKCDEAITGLSKDGSWELTGNYISDTGSIQWFLNRKNILQSITPIASDLVVKNGKIVSCIPSWSIYTVADIQALKDDALDFYGDYMCDPRRGENKFFDIQRIEEDMSKCTEPNRVSGLVKYWGVYQSHHRYGLGSDHSEGIGEDANTCVLWDFKTGIMVARYVNNEIAPDLSAHEFARLGNEFGNCIWGPEINNKCGGIVLTTALNLAYPRLYEQKTIRNGVEVSSGKVGWETNGKTKHTMFFDFKRDYNDGLIHIYDIDLLKEMKAYTTSDLSERTTGLITRHFDLLTAAVIGWQMKTEDPNNRTAKVSYHQL